MIETILRIFSRDARPYKMAALAVVLLMAAVDMQAQRQQGFVDGRYYGWDPARPMHSKALPATNVNASTASNGLLIYPGTVVQRQCATATSGAIFELVGFAIGTPAPNGYGNFFTGSFLYNQSATNCNAWRRLINYDQNTTAPTGQTATYDLGDAAIWLIVNWGQGGNARYEMKLNKDWQLVPRYGIFFQYEIDQDPPCEYKLEYLQLQGYRCNSVTGTTCNTPSAATLYYSDLSLFNGMPRKGVGVKVLNPQRDTDLRFQISSTNTANEYTVCAGDVSGRNFIDMTRFKCAGDRYVQFEYIWRKGTGNTNTGGITAASASSGGTTYATIAPNTSFANGGFSSSATTTANGRRLIPGGAGGTSNSESAYIRLPADAQSGDVVEVRMYTWNACNMPSNTTTPAAGDRFNHDNVKSAFIRVVGADVKADPDQVFTFCYPSSGYTNNYTTQIYFNGGRTNITGGTLRYYGSNAAGTAIEGSYFPNTYGTVFNPMSTNIPAQYRLVPNGNAQERTRTYWVRFLSDGGCEGDPVKIVYKVRDDISQAPGITPPVTVSVCAGKEYTFYVQNYVASSGGDAITHQWLPGTGYSIVETADGLGSTTGQWAKILIDNTVLVPPVISVLRRWTDEVTNAPQSCPAIPAGAVTTTCPSCFSNVSTYTLNITNPPTATLTGGGEICGDVAARQLTITSLSGGTGTYNVTVSGTQNGAPVSFPLSNIPNGYTFTVNPAVGSNIYWISEITANAGNSCVNNTSGAHVQIDKRDLLSFAGATITTNPSPPCAETVFTAALAGVAVPGNTILTWTYNSNSYPSAAGNTDVQIPSAGTATTGAGRPLSVTWRYTTPTADGNYCPTATPAQIPVEVIQGPTATVAPASLTPLVCEGSDANVTINLTGGAPGEDYEIIWALEYTAGGGGQIGADQTASSINTSQTTITIPAAMFPAGRGVYVFRIKSVTRGMGGCPSPPLTGNTATVTVEKMPAVISLSPSVLSTCAGLPVLVRLGLDGEPGRPYIIEYKINGQQQVPALTATAGSSFQTLDIPVSYVVAPEVIVEITSVRQEGGLGCINNASQTVTIEVGTVETANPNIDNLLYSKCVENLGDGITTGTILMRGNLPAGYDGIWTMANGDPMPASYSGGAETEIISYTPELYTLEWTIWKTSDPNCYSSRAATIYFGKSTTEAEVYYQEDSYCYDINSAVQQPYELWALRPAPRENASWGIWKIELDNGNTYSRTWQVTAGSLPPGLDIDANGKIINNPNPTTPGTYSFTTTITGVSGNTWTKVWNIVIDAAGLPTSTPDGNIPNGMAGTPYKDGAGMDITLMDPTVEPMPAQFGAITDETSYRAYATITEYGKYTYRWAVTGGCGTLYDYTTVEYIPVPVMNPIPRQELCPEQIINMPDFVAIDPVTGNPVDVTDARFAYQWAFTGTPMNLPGISGMQYGQFPANRQTPLTNSFAWEKYYINVYAHNGTCWSTPTVVEIDLKPKPPKVHFVDDVAEVCADAEVIMSMENNMWESTTYNWTVTNETEAIIVTPAGNKYASGEYRADSEAPPFSFRFKTKNGTSLPIEADFTVAATVNGCTGDLVHLPLKVNPRPVLAAPAGFEYCPYDAGVQKWVETGETTINSSVTDTKYTWVWNGNPVGFTMPAKVAGEDYSYSNKLDRFQVSDNISTGRLGGSMTVTGETYGCVSEPVRFEMWVKPRPNINVPATQSLCPEKQADGSFGGTFPAFTFRSSNLADGQVDYQWEMTPPGGGAPVSGTGNTPTPAALAFGDNTTGATLAYSWTVTATGAAGSPAAGCVSTLATPFTMNVHPRPIIDITNTNAAVCSGNDGQAFSNITFSTGVVTSSFSWNITQPPLVTGGVVTTGAAQMWGSGNQVTFSGLPYNTAPISGGGADPYIATITVNAVSVNGCAGEPTQTTLAVKQRPVMKAPAPIELCSGATQADIPLSTQNGVVPKMYHWQITDQSLWDKGSGALSNATDLTSFTVIENTTNPAVKLTTDIDVWAEHDNGCMSDKVKVPLTVRPRLRLTSSTTTIVACPGDFTEIPAFTSNVYGTDVSMITWKYTGVNNEDVSAGGSFMTTDAFNNPVGITSGGNIGAFYAAANNGTSHIEGKFTVKVGSHWSESLVCESVPVDITVTVNPTPPKPVLADYDLAVPEIPVFCHGTANVSIAFKNVAGTTFSWESSDAGLTGAASGTTNPLVFAPINNTALQLSERNAKILVRAHAGADGKACPSDPLEFPVIIRPVPQINETYPALLTGCSGTDFNIPGFSLHNRFFASNYDPENDVHTVYDWAIDPNNASAPDAIWSAAELATLPAASGSANPVPVFTPMNTGSNPKTLSLTVTPTYETCKGIAKSIDITIHPTPVITGNVDLTKPIESCSGTKFADIVLSGGVSGTTPSWNFTSSPITADGELGTTSTVGTGTIKFTNLSKNIINPEFKVGLKITATSPAGCPAKEINTELVVLQEPVMNAITPNPVVLCSEESYTLGDFSISNNAVLHATQAYHWSVSGDALWSAPPGISGDVVLAMPSFTTIRNASATDRSATVTVYANHENGCKSAEKTFTVKVRPVLTVTAVNPEIVCPGEIIPKKQLAANISTGTKLSWSFTGAATTMIDATAAAPLWTGTPVSGDTETPSFKAAANTTGGTLTGTFALTAEYTTGGPACVSKGTDSKTFTVTVKPTPDKPVVIDPVSANPLKFAYCHGATVPIHKFQTALGATQYTSASPDVTFNWTRTGDIGLGTVSNIGNLPSFTAANTVAGQLSEAAATIEVYATVAECSSEKLTYTIAVKPVPKMLPFGDITLCSGATSNLSNPVISDFKLVSAFATSDPSNFKWRISNNWFQDSDLPDPNSGAPAVPVWQDGYLAGASAIPPARDFTPVLPTGSTSPTVMTLTVIPMYDLCEGAPSTSSITVNPLPVIKIDNLPERPICSGEQFATISFSSTVASAFGWNISAPPAGTGITTGAAATASTPATREKIDFPNPAVHTADLSSWAGSSNPYTATVTVHAASTTGSCAANETFPLQVWQAPVVTPFAGNITACSDETITAVGTPNRPIEFSPPNGAAVDNYSWRTTNASIWNLATSTVTANTPPALTYMPPFTTASVATETTADVFVTAQAKYTYGTPAVDYFCKSAEASFALTVRPKPEVTSSHADQTVCPDKDVIINNFTFNPSAVTGAATGGYWRLTGDAVSKNSAHAPHTPPAFSSGNIGNFKSADNPGPGNLAGTFTYWAAYPDMTYCKSDDKIFTVTVDHTPATPVFIDQTFDDPAKRVFCNDVLVNDLTFAAVSGVDIHWISMGDDIGLASTSGTGNLSPFTTDNSKADYTAAVANIKVTVQSTVGAGCSSSRSFDITVQPVAVMRNFGTTEICSDTEYYAGLPTPRPVFEFSNAFATANGNNTGNASNFTWSITSGYDGALFDPALVLPANGNGYLPDFKPVVTGDDPVNMTLTVTPSWKGCPGTPRDFTVRLHPLPVVTAIAPTPVCSGDRFANINLSANIAGSTFAWEILPMPLPAGISTGIVLPGSGNTITFGAATNTVQSSYTATLSVTATSQAGCKGTATTAGLTIKQKPVMQPLPGLDACSGVVIAPSPTLTTDLAQTEIGSYNWRTNKQSAWNLPVSGTVLPADPNWPAMPDITMFNETNPSGEIAQITVSATHANGCISDEVSFNITVWPAPVVKPVPIPEYCPETKVTLPVFAASIPGSQLYWESVSGHQVSSYFDPASPDYIGRITDTGAIPDFVTLPLSGAQATGTFNLWATMKYNNGAITCSGNKTPVDVIVNPTPKAPVYNNPNAASEFCDGDKVLPIGFTPVAGVTFSWKKISGNDVGLPVTSGNGALPEFTAVNTTTGRLGAGRAEIMATAWAAGCSSKEDAFASFTITVKPVPQILTPDPVELCGNETYPGQAFTLHPDIPNNYPGGATAFDWVIAGNIPESGLPDNSSGGIPSFTPDDSYLPPNKPQATHPLWSNTPTSMTLSVTPKYAGCEGKPVAVSILLKPRPITTIGTNEDNCIKENGVKIYYANNGRWTLGSTFKWELDGHNPPVINGNSHLLSLSFPDDGWIGTLSVVETNVFTCQGEKQEMPLKLVPVPIVWAGNDFEICYGNVKTLQGQLLNGDKLPNHANDLDYEWFPMNDINPGATALTPLLTGTVSRTIRLRALDKANGCWSEPSIVNVTVLPSPVAPVVPSIMLCESDALMTMTALNVAANETMYWQRLEESSPGVWTPVPIAGSDGKASVNMKEHIGGLPASLWSITEVETVIHYQVYKTAAVNAEVCESPVSQAELKINRTPDAPVAPHLFTYCENDKSPYYELNVTTTGTNIGAVNWYEDATGKHLGSGLRFMVHQPGSSAPATGIYTHEPFYFNAVANSAANCPSIPAKVPLIVYPNPALSFVMTDKNGDPTTGGCSPFEVTAANTSGESDVNYRWIWTPAPNDQIDDVPVGGAKKWTYYATIAEQVRVQLTGVSKVHEESETPGKFCSSILEKTLLITPGVKANFEASDTVGCDALSVRFISSSEGAYRFRWYWNTPAPPAFDPVNPALPGNNPSDPLYGVVGAHPTYAFENKNSGQPKRYHVWLQVDNGQCHDNKDTIITVYPVPNAAFKHNLTGGSICPPLPVNFDNQSAGTANNDKTRYIWDFADGNFDTVTIARGPFDHFYENRVLSVPVQYAVKMTAFNRYAVTGRDSLTCYSPPAQQFIMVNPQVEAKFTGPDKGCSPFTATFQSQSIGSPTHFVWDFGDGTSLGTGTTPEHTFVNNTRDQVKQCQVKLTAGNNWCYSTTSKLFTLYPQPVASFRVDETAGCQPFNAIFTNTSIASGNPSSGITYTYDFNDGSSVSIDDASTVSHIFTNVGGTDLHTYPALTAKNEWGCVSNPYTQWITVFPYLKARFEMEDSIGCGPLAVRFRNGSLGYSSYQYTFGDGYVANGDPTSSVLTGHVYKTDNMYEDKTFNVTLKVRRGNCEDSQTKQVLVYSTPVANFRPGTPYPADYPFPAAPIQVDNLIQAPDADHLIYRWSWTNTETEHTEEFGTTKAPTPFKIEDWGHFSITQHVTAPNGKCSDSKTLTFNIVPPVAKALFDAISPDCVPYEPLFVNNSEYAKSYIWDFGDGNTSGDKNPKHTFMKPGTFTVTLTARGYNMVEQTFTREVTVHPTPQAGFEVSSNFRWVGQAVDATNYTTHVTADGQPYDVWYRWNWGDNSPEDTKETPDPHMYRKADAYDITLTVGTYTAPQCTSVAVKTNAVTLESAGDIILPNIFKPVPSGEPSDVVPETGYKNYLFYPPVLSPTRTYSMRIFNRWGQEIFHTTDRNRGWNGYARGRLCSEGVYIYKIEGVFETGQSFQKVGDVTLLR